MRRPLKKKKETLPDFKYNSVRVEKFVNYIMKNGNKNIARRVVYDAFDIMGKKVKTDNPLEIFEKALRNVGPAVEVRPRRIGGANYMVPKDVRAERKDALAMRWIIEAAHGYKGKPMREGLAAELIAASNNEGAAISKKLTTHKMAEANRAFAHFA